MAQSKMGTQDSITRDTRTQDPRSHVPRSWAYVFIKFLTFVFRLLNVKKFSSHVEYFSVYSIHSLFTFTELRNKTLKYENTGKCDNSNYSFTYFLPIEITDFFFFFFCFVSEIFRQILVTLTSLTLDFCLNDVSI